MTAISAWIGRTETAEDVATPGPLAGLAALLDHTTPPWRAGGVPPLGHWLYFLPREPQSEIAGDGHPHRGGFLPPVALPRRMWAGSRVEFHAPIPIGAALTRLSTITAIEEKRGRTGALCFVTVRHDITADGTLCVTDVHDIVYREAATANDGAPPAPVASEAAAWMRSIHPGPVMLFRFSALTFNAHRIHYDRNYCHEEEGYPGLVVHGPLTAVLLMDLFLREHPGADVASFFFRGVSPLFDIEPVALCGRAHSGGASLWARDEAGRVKTRAGLMLRSTY